MHPRLRYKVQRSRSSSFAIAPYSTMKLPATLSLFHALPLLVLYGAAIAPLPAHASLPEPVSFSSNLTPTSNPTSNPTSQPIELARRRDRDVIYPPSPLENAEPDPWWPDASIPLTETDRRVLRPKLDELNVSATAALAINQPDVAFELWNRELRLRRLIGLSDELIALERVGEIAWKEEEFYQLQVISRRLRDLQYDLLGDPFEENPDRPAPDLTTLRLLADAFAAVRDRESAVDAYEYLLADAHDREDIIVEEETLRTIGELNYGDLNYEDAVIDYEELVDLADARGDQASRVFYLERLAFMYDQLERPSDAIRIKQALVLYYQAIADVPRTTALYIALGNDFAATGEIAAAEQNYVSAYGLAWDAKQFYRAGEAIDRLAELYDREARYEDALKTYRIAIDIDTISNDRYGLMVTYDTIGQLYQRLNAYAQALDAYQRGLEVAQQISSRTSYFQFQIDTVSRLLRR